MVCEKNTAPSLQQVVCLYMEIMRLYYPLTHISSSKSQTPEKNWLLGLKNKNHFYSNHLFAAKNLNDPGSCSAR